MKLASFLFTLFFIMVVTLPSFAFSEKENSVKVSMTVDEHISYSVKSGALKVTTNRDGGFWILEKNSLQTPGTEKEVTTKKKKETAVYIVSKY